MPISTTSKQSLLWELQHPTQTTPSYLFGTMHVKDERAFRGFDQLCNYIQTCAAFAAEIDLEEADQAAFYTAAQLPNGTYLGDYISPQIYQKLDRLVQQQLHMRLAQVHHYTPMILVDLFSRAQLSNNHLLGLDQALHAEAVRSQKAIFGLETFEEQLAILQKINLKEQMRSLKALATNFSSFRKNMQAATNFYAAGNLQGVLQQSKRSLGSARRVILYNRNAIMSERFHALAQQQSLFAAVGAAHLPGSKGMLRLLKHQGYHVRPIFY